MLVPRIHVHIGAAVAAAATAPVNALALPALACCSDYSDQCVVMLSQDSFYRNLNSVELKDVKCGWTGMSSEADGGLRCRWPLALTGLSSS